MILQLAKRGLCDQLLYGSKGYLTPQMQNQWMRQSSYLTLITVPVVPAFLFTLLDIYTKSFLF